MKPDTINVYISGSGGFLGSVLKTAAPTGMRIIPIPTNDLLSEDVPLRFEPGSVVLHLGARVHVMHETAANPLEEFRTANVRATTRLAKAAIESGVATFIFASSVFVFGRGRFSKGIIPDDSPPFPGDAYGQSKWEAEQALAALFSSQWGSRCVILRLPMVYGPGNKGNMLLLLKMASKGIPMPLGAARGKRSMLYSGNFTDAIFAVIRAPHMKPPTVRTYFLNDGADLTSAELYAAISRCYSGKQGIFFFPRWLLDSIALIFAAVGRITGWRMMLTPETVSRLFDEYRFSAQQFMNDYGWRPPFTPEEGIRQTVAWHKTGKGGNPKNGLCA
ncbi:MAG: NAD-dependent epimerase/dehydratase family protein [Nitrospinae bacterium]|nr:NAD-dependent epimerase/dehydratase family protein [Nitrospinota bacterium]